MRRFSRFFFFGVVACLCFMCFAQPFSLLAQESSAASFVEDVEPVVAKMLLEDKTIQPGLPFWVAVRLELDDHWHAYWKNPGDTGFPLSIDWHLPEGFQVESVLWPIPEKKVSGSSVVFGYEKEIILLAQIVPAEAFEEEEVEIGADVRWLVCSDKSCLPGNTEVSITLSVKESFPEPDTRRAEFFSRARSKLPKKSWDFVAQKREGGVDLVISLDGVQAKNLTKVEFFPEQKGFVDHKSDPILVNIEGSPEQCLVSLNTVGDLEDMLRGILVLRGEGESVVQAYDVEVPLKGAKGNSKEFVAVASTQKQHSSVGMYNPLHEEGIGLVLLFAFLGGAILNLMPCVLPVISFKVLSFMNMAGQSRSETLKHGLFFSLGVLVSFWVLAGFLLVLQAYGRAVGWGFQLQEPLFVAVLATVLVVFGLSLFGVFEFGTLFASWAGQHTQGGGAKEGALGSFFSGVLATAVATPCTGPFLGSAVGVAVTLPPHLAMLVFTFLGAGMAFPYLILSAFPALLVFLPKPGSWMVTFKELMGFVMFATTLWLVWVFGAQTSALAVTILFGGLLLMAFATWVHGKWGSPIKKKAVRMASLVVALSVFCLGGYLVYSAATPSEASLRKDTLSEDSSEEGWEPFSPKRLAELQSQGVPVFVDFTAKWCLICQTNHLVLSQEDVDVKLRELGVVKMLADWTKSDPEITQELRKFGRNGVPLYVLYGSDATQPPEILPQVLTPNVVLEHLEKVKPRKAIR